VVKQEFRDQRMELQVSKRFRVGGGREQSMNIGEVWEDVDGCWGDATLLAVMDGWGSKRDGGK
jgi:hypothetical protein